MIAISDNDKISLYSISVSDPKAWEVLRSLFSNYREDMLLQLVDTECKSKHLDDVLRGGYKMAEELMSKIDGITTEGKTLAERTRQPI